MNAKKIEAFSLADRVRVLMNSVQDNLPAMDGPNARAMVLGEIDEAPRWLSQLRSTVDSYSPEED